MNSPNQYHSRRHTAIAVDESELLVESFGAAPLQCVQTTAGTLGARISDVSTSRVEVREACFDAGISLTIPDPFPRLGVGIRLAGDMHVLGMRLTSSNIVFINGNNGMVARLKPGTRWCNISLDWDLVYAVAETHGYAVPGAEATRGVPVHEHRALGDMLSRVARSEQYGEFSDAEVEDALARSILRTLNRQRSGGKDLRGGHWRTVQRVIEYIQAEFSGPVTVTGLCQQAGVSERTLQYRFKEATDLSVQQYLMNYRLQQARARLMRGEYERVSEAASACGIHHAGRFSQYYKCLFGQLPGETLAGSGIAENAGA